MLMTKFTYNLTGPLHEVDTIQKFTLMCAHFKSGQVHVKFSVHSLSSTHFVITTIGQVEFPMNKESRFLNLEINV